MSSRFGAVTLLLLVTRLTFALPDAVPAAAPAAQRQAGMLDMLPWIVIFGGAFYLFVIMPGNKQRKQMQALLDGLKVGDRVLMNCGMYGRVHQLKDDSFSLRVAEGTHIEFAKSAISKVITEEHGNGK